MPLNLSDENQNQSLETDSNIYGRTYNPFNTNLTSGGGGDGESALITCHGSLLLLGTDIGSSIVSFVLCTIHCERN
jgi:Asp-tRNA(Asn)/Glu-tRNA(Gln) amidotransferase A subunit family amidase